VLDAGKCGVSNPVAYSSEETAMSSLTLAALAGLALAAAPAPPSPEGVAKKDLAKMQGTWTVESVRHNGSDEPAESVAKDKVVIDGDKFTIKHDGRDEESKIKLDPTKTPKALDVSMPSGEVMLGIYEIEGDRLRIAVTGPPEKTPKEEGRAAKFESAEGSGVVLVVLKREKKAAENKLPEAAQKALEGAKDLDLYSLDPTAGEKAKDEFHGWRVLGKTTLKKDDANAVAAAVVKGVADSDGSVPDCFNPRHGVRVTGADGTAYDFVICFECLQIKVYAGAKELPGALTAKSPQPNLDKLLKDAGVPLAPKPGADK
jgi:uncharacterized protein (TIGR03067 family)